MTQEEIKNRLKASDRWIRLIYMLVFAIVLYFVLPALFLLVAIVQFVLSILLGNPNEQLLGFTEGLCTWSYQMFRFLVYNSEEKPFPFGTPWPSEKKSEAKPVEPPKEQ